jgi:hypothetical protein
MKRRLTTVFYLLLLMFSSKIVNAQITIGPGVVNKYYPVTAITAAATGICDPTGSPVFTLGAPLGSGPAVTDIPLTQGNKVLIIQMMAGTSGSVKSGVANKFPVTAGVSSTCAYGDILTTIGNAGNYEYALISTVSGSQITFTKPLLYSYNVDGMIQVIPVAGYSAASTNVNTSGVITPLAWTQTYDSLGVHGTNLVGGVVAIESNGGTLTINGNVDASKMGFKGGPFYNQAYDRCCNSGTGPSITAGAQQYACYYDETSGNANCDATKTFSMGGPKGSGIFGVISGQGLGYSHIANGGGGGCNHNSGGGGGGGATQGGQGGYEFISCNNATTDKRGGQGGLGFSNAIRAFMGGGGGCASGNEAVYTPGGHGGGIIMLKASVISVPATVTLDASGAGALTASVIGGLMDGAGGGGGGGTILIEVGTWSLAAILTVKANGGKGGDNNAGQCHGVGGGGGGGNVGVSSSDPNLSLSSAGGPNGVFTVASVATSCGNWGAGSGTNVTPVSSGVTLNQNTCTTTPVTFISFHGEQSDKNVDLFWYTASEANSSLFEIERSFDGYSFTTIGKIAATGNSSDIRSYSYTDYGIVESGSKVFYRIKEVDIDGLSYYTKIISVNFKGEILHILHSNPVADKLALTITYLSSMKEGGELQIVLYDGLGKEILSENHFINNGENEIVMNVGNLSKGFYILKAKEGVNTITSKLIIE